MYDFQRFIDAQRFNYKIALDEVKDGRKQSHWMWYVFPQIHGLSKSSYGQMYSLQSLDEAKEYLKDPVLGKRLIEISEAALIPGTNDAGKVFGYPDDMKLCSSMTLFEMADPTIPVFGKVIDKYFEGRRDERTLQILKEENH